jgi:hypothetical protein
MTVTIGNGITIGAGIAMTLPPPGLVTAGMLLNFDAATYTSGDWIDSYNGVPATPYNNPTWSSDNGGTFLLDANSIQYFSVPWPTLQPTFTLDIWFNFTGNQPGDACLISDEFTGAPFNFTILVAGNYLQTGWYTTNWQGQYATNNTPTALPTDGSTWYNIVMAVDTATYKDYINGAVSYDPGSFSSIGIAPPNGSSPTQRFFIGHRWDLPDTVNAKMSVVNVYDRALTDVEVTQNFDYYRSRFGL